MRFTQNDIEEIRLRLAQTGRTKKDTELDVADPLTGSEVIALVQGSKNVQLPLSEFIDNLDAIAAKPVVNVSDDGVGGVLTFATLEAAIFAVPADQRVTGQILVYYTTEGWHIYQFIGVNVPSQFNNTDYWENVIPTGLPPTGAAGGDLTGTYPNPTLGNSVVDFDNIANDAVRSQHIEDQAITTPKYALNSIPETALGDNSVPTRALQPNSVTQAKIDSTVRIASPGTLTIQSPNGTIEYDGSGDNFLDITPEGITIAQSRGASTTAVMSQNAVSSELYADPATGNNVKIGNNSSASGNNSIALGSGASTSEVGGVSIGPDTSSSGYNSVALGANSSTFAADILPSDNNGIVSVGSSNNFQRRIINVSNAINDNDAVNLSQIASIFGHNYKFNAVKITISNPTKTPGTTNWNQTIERIYNGTEFTEGTSVLEVYPLQAYITLPEALLADDLLKIASMNVIDYKSVPQGSADSYDYWYLLTGSSETVLLRIGLAGWNDPDVEGVFTFYITYWSPIE